MALQKGQIALRFQGGVDLKSDSKTVAATKLLGLENGTFVRGTSIAKRHGYSALSTAVLGSAEPYIDARGLAARGSELLLLTEQRCYSYVDGAAQWSDAGVVQSVAQSDRAIAKAPAVQTMGDYAACSGVGVAAWEDSRGGVYWCVVEDDQGHIIRAVAQASSTGSRPRCVRVGDKLAVIWAEAALGQLKLILVDPTAPHTYDTTQFPRTIVVDVVTTQPGFDAAYVGNVVVLAGNAACICWNSTLGVYVGWLDPSGVIGSPVTGWPSPLLILPGASVTCGPTIAAAPWIQDQWGVAWATALNSYATVVDGNPLAVRFSALALGVGGVDNLTCAWRYRGADTGEDALDVWLENTASPARNSFVTRKVIEVDGIAQPDPAQVIRGACLASKGFSDPPLDNAIATTDDARDDERSASFVTIVHDVPIFGVYMTVRHDGVVVARTLPGVAGDAPARSHLPSVTYVPEGRVHRWVAGSKQQLDGIDGDVFTEQGLRLVSLDFDSGDAHQSAQIGASLYLGGACPQVYDGQSWVEHNFHYGVDWETSDVLGVQAAGGSLDPLGTYSWIFVPEYTLANGEIVLGPPSKPYEVELTGANVRVTLTIPTIRLTRMTASTHIGGRSRAEARIGVYRSLNGDASAYYRCSSLNPSTSTGSNRYVANDPTADSVTFVDDMSDAVLLTKEPLYTNGGILENDPVATGGDLVVGKGRLFATHPSDGNVVLFSQERADGRAVEMPDGLQIRVDDAGGDIQALAVMDDALVIFKRGAIYFVAGPGPLANPELGGGFTAATLITSDVGCIAAKSIASTPMGLVFQSAKGIYLLDRGRSVSYVGAPVEQYNDQAIVRATLVEDTTQIRFLTDSGSTLLYDYLFGQWSTFTRHEGKDALVLGGVYHYLRNDGAVFREASDSYADNGTRIPLVIDTAWIHVQDHLQGFQRIWHALILGTRQSAHTLRVSYRLDYEPSWSEPVAFDATTVGGTSYGEGAYGAGPYGGSSPTPFQFRFHVGRKCQAIQFRFEDYEAAGVAGASFELTELTLTGGVKGPAYKLPAGRSA